MKDNRGRVAWLLLSRSIPTRSPSRPRSPPGPSCLSDTARVRLLPRCGRIVQAV